jgi:hypothetical protein
MKASTSAVVTACRIGIDEAEEHFQIECGGQHGVPPGAAPDELQEGVEQRVTKVDLFPISGPRRADETRYEAHGHLLRWC